MRAYYLYEKSPKKCRELDEVVASYENVWRKMKCLVPGLNEIDHYVPVESGL